MQVGAQDGSMNAPDGPGEAPAGRPGGRKMLIFMCVYSVCRFRMHLTPRFMFMRVLRSVKLNDDSRDVSVSHSPTFSQMKMQFLRGAA